PATRRGRAPYAYYRCVGSDAYRFVGGRVCHNGQVRVDQLDAYVWDAVRTTLEDPQRLAAEWSRRAHADAVSTEQQMQRAEAARVVSQHERTLERLLDAYEAGALALADLKARTERVRARLERARADLAVAEERVAQAASLRAVITRLEDFAGRVRDRL